MLASDNLEISLWSRELARLSDVVNKLVWRRELFLRFVVVSPRGATTRCLFRTVLRNLK